LGVKPIPQGYDQTPWHQERGPAAFAPFDADTSYFGSAKNTWMVNFRVRDLDAMLAQLRSPV
jgi:glyoxylase I family protein